MDILPKEELDAVSIKEEAKPNKAVRRKREKKVERCDPVAHVVISTSPLKSKLCKAEGKKLRKKLQEFEQENETLAKTISEKNQEISSLKKSVDSLNDVLNSVPIDELRCNSSIASSKIIELSKKNRSMRAEVEQLKNRISKKDAHIDKLERELKIGEEKFQQSNELAKKYVGDDSHAKMHTMQQKLFESRNKNIELQSQLKLAQKCLQHEIGENVNINALFNNQEKSTWRGRAQQILTLQQKLQELRARLETYEERMQDRTDYISSISMGSDLDMSSPLKSPKLRTLPSNANGAGDSNTMLSNFDRFTPSVRKSELLHRAKVEALEKEISTLQQQLEEQRAKTLALKVRNKTLNDEMTRYKMKSNSLEEQTDYNGINVQSICDKLNKQRHQFENRLEDARGDLIKVTEERDNALRQMEELRHKNVEIEMAVQEREAFVLQLQDMVKKLETDLRAVSGGFLFSCREFRKEEFVSILDALEVEKQQLILQCKKLNERLNSEREKYENTLEQVAKQKTRIIRLEAKIRDLEKDLDSQAERKKRTQRMSEYANSLSRTSLNGSVTSFSFDNQSMCTSTQSAYIAGIEPKHEDLRDQLELANEKILMLNEKVGYLTDEKNSDAKFFEETLANSKNIILDTIIGHRETQRKNGSNIHSESGTATTSEEL